MDGFDVDPAVLKTASEAAAELMDRLLKDGRIVDDSNNAAAGALSQNHFQLGRSLKKTADLWYQQMTTLIQATHKIEQALAANAGDYRLVEDKSEMSMSDISRYFQ
jgi:uncharacterized protein YukE